MFCIKRKEGINMFDSLKKWRRLCRLRKLTKEQVKFDGKTISIETPVETIVLKAVASLEDKSVTISGDGIVVDNRVVKAIWTALWEVQLAEKSPLTFGDCEVIAEPNFIKITKKEVIVIDE